MNKPNFGKIMKEIDEILEKDMEKHEKLQEICNLLKNRIPYYNWVGFYMADNEKKELLIGPFSGEDTEHKRLKFGKGICGQAAEEKKTIIVKDVTKERNYLSCSPKVKSEIVVPIFKNGIFVGEIDIDSHYVNAFGIEDREFLEKISKKVAEII